MWISMWLTKFKVKVKWWDVTHLPLYLHFCWVKSVITTTTLAIVTKDAKPFCPSIVIWRLWNQKKLNTLEGYPQPQAIFLSALKLNQRIWTVITPRLTYSVCFVIWVKSIRSSRYDSVIRSLNLTNQSQFISFSIKMAHRWDVKEPSVTLLQNKGWDW